MAYAIKESAGAPYRPSNGTEGERFMSDFCCRCAHDIDESCPIIGATMRLNIGDDGYPPEWTHDAEGQPTCTNFAALFPAPPKDTGGERA